jgi:hypothetical protein
MTKDEREAAMLPIWNARDEWWASMADEQRVKCDFYLCTIFDEAVYIAKSLSETIDQLGHCNASIKAAIMEHGHYPYCGIKFCKVIPLGDWILKWHPRINEVRMITCDLCYLLFLQLLNTSHMYMI